MERLDDMVSMRLTKEEHQRLAHLARLTRRSKSDTLRHLLALAQVDDAGNIVLTPAGERR